MDQSNLPQSTPVVPPIDPNVGNIQEMELNDIVGAYDQMGQGIDQLGQNVLADVAGRQQQLIGNDFGTPAEGPMGDYNENTYISPVVSSARSQVAQIGTQVALNEGIRRSEEAAEEKLKETQKRYNEFVAEQNRKAAEAARQQENAARAQNALVNAVDPEFLKERGLTQDDFAALDLSQRGQILRDFHDDKRSIDWSDKSQWYKAVDEVYKKFGITGDAAKDERTGNQSEANKALWKREDVGDYFTQQYLNKYGDGAQILKERNHFLQTTQNAIETWINPKNEEERLLGFDAVFRAVAFTFPTKTLVAEGSAADLLEQVEIYKKDDRRTRALNSEEQAEVNRLAREIRNGNEAGASRLQELLSKAAPGGAGGGGGWRGDDEYNEYELRRQNWSPEAKTPTMRYQYGEEEVTVADVMEGLFGLEASELVALKDFKEKNSEDFRHIMDISARVHSGTFISRSDGTDVPDNYYRDPTSGEMKLAPNGQIIIHSMAGGHEDPQLKKMKDMLDDEMFMESASRGMLDDPNATDEDRKRAKQFDEVTEQYRQNQIAAIYLGEAYQTTAGSSLYNAALYRPGDDESSKLMIKGKKINDIIWEWRTLTREDQEAAAVMFRDLVAAANRDVGYFTDKDGRRIPLVDEHGESTISARGGHYSDYSVEESAAVLAVLQKAINAGELDGKFLGKGPGTGFGAGGKIAESAGTTFEIIKMASGFIAGGYFDDNQQTLRGKLYYGGAKNIVSNNKGEWGYQTRKDEENYDTFRTLLDVQYSAEGEDGWFGKSTDVGVGAKRFGGEIAAFGADVGFGLIGPIAAKGLAVHAARRISTKLVSSAGERLAKEIAGKVGEKYAMSVPQDIAMFEVKDAAGNVAKKTLNEISTDIARLSLDGKSAAGYLKQIDPVAFKGIGQKTMGKMLEDAWGNKIAKKLGVPAAAQRTMNFIERDAAGITSLTLSGVPMRSIERASEPALRAAVRLVAEYGDEIIGTVARRNARQAGAATVGKEAGERFGALTGRQMAKELVQESAKRRDNGFVMNKYDVLKFMAKRGDDNARKRVFATRFLEGELVGNALFVPSLMRNTLDPETGESLLQDPSYILSEVAIGSALSLGGMGIARAVRGAQLTRVQGRLEKAQNAIVRNAQDINSPEYRKAVAELDKLSTRAEMLSDDAMEYAFSPDKVAEFRKTAADAKAAIIKQLDYIQNQFQPETFGKSIESKQLIDSLTAKQGFGRRYILSMSSLRSEATIDYRRLTSDLPLLSSLDDRASARVTADAYDAVKKLPEGSTFEEQREAFIEGIARAMTGTNYKEARREAEYLMEEYSKTWDMIVKAADDGIIDINTYGGRARSAYLSPAGITHTMSDDLAKVNWGIVTERKVNADIAKPTIKRTADHGAVARAWLEGKQLESGHIKVRNPAGFNLVTSLHTYNNMMRSEIYLNSIDRGIVKNGDAIILGRHNVEAAVQADRNYYTKQLADAKAELKALKKSLPSGSKAADAVEDTPEMTAIQERIGALETQLKAYQGVNLPSSLVSIAAKVSGVSEDEFVKEYTAMAGRLKANKEAILAGGDPDEELARYTRENGDYSRDSVLEAVFNKYDGRPDPTPALGTSARSAAESQYMKGVSERQQELIRKRSVDNEYTRSVLNEGMRHFSESDAGAGVYGVGDLVEWVAQRLPLSKTPKDNLDSLKWKGLSGLLTKQGVDQQLAKAFRAGDEDVKLFIEAINVPRSEGNVMLREYDSVAESVQRADNELDEAIGEIPSAYAYSEDAMMRFEELPTDRKQAAISFVDDMLRPSLYGKSAPAIEKIPFEGTGRPVYPKEVLDRQHNLAEIVARNNILDPEFDESPMFDRFIVPEGGEAGSVRAANTPDGSAVEYYRSTRLPDGTTVEWEEIQQALRNHRRMFGEYYADPIFLNRTQMDAGEASFYTLGSYNYEEDLIRLATDNADLVGTGYHEAVHRVIGQFLDDAEVHQLYKDMLVSVGGKRKLNELYGDSYTGGWRQQAEEHIANAFREYKANRLPDYKRRGAQKRVAEMAEKLNLPESVIRIFDALFDRIQGFVYGSAKGRAASRDNIINLFKRIDSGEFADAMPKGRTKSMSSELRPAALKALDKLKSEMRYKGAIAAIDLKYRGKLAAIDVKSKASFIAEVVGWIGRQLGDDVAAMKKAIEASSLARYEKAEAKALLDHTERFEEIQRRFDEEMASRAEAASRAPRGRGPRLTEDLVDADGKVVKRGVLLGGQPADDAATTPLPMADRLQSAAEIFDNENSGFNVIFSDEDSRIRELIEQPSAQSLLQVSGLPASDYADLDNGGLGDLQHIVDIVTDDYQRQFDELLDNGDITPAEYSEWGTGIQEKVERLVREIADEDRVDDFNRELEADVSYDVERTGSSRGARRSRNAGGFTVRLPEEDSIPMRQSALARFYAEAGDTTEAENAIRKSLRSERAALTRAQRKQSAVVRAEVEALDSSLSDTKAKIRAAQKRAKEARERLKDVNSYKEGDAYVNRNGLKFLDDANGLTGYTKLNTILDSQEALPMLPGLKNKMENRRRKAINRAGNAVNRQSINAREANYNDVVQLVQEGASGSADNAEIRVTEAMMEDKEFKKAFPKAKAGDMLRRNDSVADDGLLINHDDILVHEGLANIKSIEQRQFSSRQGLQMAMLKVSGFNKAIQNMQLSAGVSMFNAYSFRFLLSAMMQNPTQALPMLRTFSDARNMKHVASFWSKNQELFNRVTMVTGDSMYVDAFSDANSLAGEQSTGYIARMAKAGKQTAYKEVMDRYTPEERARIAKRAGYDSPENAPVFDSSTARAEKRGRLSHGAHYVAKAVELTWDAPTFQRYIPVLQGTLFLKNYDLALKRMTRNVTREFKSGVRQTPEVTAADIDNVLLAAHIRTKLFFHPMSGTGSARDSLKFTLRGSTFDNETARNFIDNLTDAQVKEIVKGNQGNNANKILSSMFFALEYKATQIGQMLNGIRGVGAQDSFLLQGSKNQVSIMTALIGAAFLFNELNDRETAFDNPEKLLLNLNNLGKFRLGDGNGTPSIDPFFSQFTLLNAFTRMGYGMANIEGGTATNNTNPHRGYGPFRIEIPVLTAMQDEVVSNLLSPYKTMAEILTNNTYFGNNIWEHATMKDGTPNPNYNLFRNVGSSVMHMLNLQSSNAYVKGENTTQDRIGRTSGSGILQHPYLDMWHAYQQGDYADALFTALEMPVKWDNMSGAARNSLNGYVIKSIAGYKRDYDKKVEAAKGDKAKVDEAYKVFAEQSIKTITDWSARNGNPLENDPKLISAAQKILTGFLSDEYDDNLNRMQSAFWRARIESQMGDDFEFDMRPGETEEEFIERKDKVNAFWFGQLDKEYEARQILEESGFDTQGFDYQDMMTEYRNMHRNVIAQFEKAIKGKVSGFDNLKEQKKNYEMRIGNVDEIYTNTKKAREKKTQLANEHNKAVLDLLTPYVEQYGPYTLDMYDRGNKRGLADMAAELIIIPAEELWKYGTNKTPEKNYLKDQFGVGYRNNSNLPSDTEFKKRFDKVNSDLRKGATASASSLLDRIIREVQRGQYGVSGADWSRVVRYREIINGRLGL